MFNVFLSWNNFSELYLNFHFEQISNRAKINDMIRKIVWGYYTIFATTLACFR